MRLSELLKDIKYECIKGKDDREVSCVVYDSRKLCKDCVFVCIKGANFDGHSPL